MNSSAASANSSSLTSATCRSAWRALDPRWSGQRSGLAPVPRRRPTARSSPGASPPGTGLSWGLCRADRAGCVTTSQPAARSSPIWRSRSCREVLLRAYQKRRPPEGIKFTITVDSCDGLVRQGAESELSCSRCRYICDVPTPGQRGLDALLVGFEASTRARGNSRRVRMRLRSSAATRACAREGLGDRAPDFNRSRLVGSAAGPPTRGELRDSRQSWRTRLARREARG